MRATLSEAMEAGKVDTQDLEAARMGESALLGMAKENKDSQAVLTHMVNLGLLNRGIISAQSGRLSPTYIDG